MFRGSAGGSDGLDGGDAGTESARRGRAGRVSTGKLSGQAICRQPRLRVRARGLWRPGQMGAAGDAQPQTGLRSDADLCAAATAGSTPRGHHADAATGASATAGDGAATTPATTGGQDPTADAEPKRLCRHHRTQHHRSPGPRAGANHGPSADRAQGRHGSSSPCRRARAATRTGHNTGCDLQICQWHQPQGHGDGRWPGALRPATGGTGAGQARARARCTAGARG